MNRSSPLVTVPPYKHYPSPENNLWLAVIDRAMVDFIKGYQGQHALDKKYLYKFFYDKKARPYNLLWICDMVFDDPGLSKTIISRMLKVKRLYDDNNGNIDDILVNRAGRRIHDLE